MNRIFMLHTTNFNLIFYYFVIFQVDEFEKYAKFEDGYKREDVTVEYFFQILREWDDSMRAHFLFFLTGTLLQL